MSKSVKSRGWLTLIYPDSGDINNVHLLDDRGLSYVISPIHDRDLMDDKVSFKKPHYHVLILWVSPTTLSCAQSFVDLIGGVGCLPCASVTGSVRYFLHLDNPEKFQYCFDDMISHGVDLFRLIASEEDDLRMLFDIFDWVRSNRVTSFRVTVDYCIANRPDWARLIFTKYRENLWRYLRSFEYDLKSSTRDGIDYL